MPRHPKVADEPVLVRAIRDGVFVADDERIDEGEEAIASPEDAKVLIERGHVVAV